MANTKKKNNSLPAEVLEESEGAKLDLKNTTGSKIDDTVLIKVKSTCYGRLYYRNSKTSEETRWEKPGEVQLMTFGDLRAMKADQIDFFVNHWIVILGVADGSECSATCADIYKVLMITKYYEDYVEPTDYQAICAWEEDEIGERVAMMSGGAQENLIVALNECIKNGVLDSVKKIRAFENALGCQLTILD